MSTEYRKLYRSRKDRMVGGVAAGVAEYFNIDPTLIRLAFVALVLWGGSGVILYILMWIIVPEEPVESPPPAPVSPPATDDDEVPPAS